MHKKKILIGLGILVILLALAGTGSAHPSYSCTPSNCHGFDGNFFYNTHKFDGISTPTVGTSCAECHVNPPDDMALTSNGSFYNSTHRYNATTLASVMFTQPACGNCHVNVINNDFTKLSGTATYLTSTTCENCHKAKYDNWTNTLHRVMLTEKSKAQAMGLPEPEVGWANISYVIVTKFEFAYINTTGYFPAQNDAYETETKEFVNSSHAGGAYGTCGRCHTTGWNTSGWSNITLNGILPGINGTFNEPGIACERCHKPAGNGHQVVVNYSGDQCFECHSGRNHGTGWENGEHAPPPYENGSCMFCHSSFDQYKNQNVTIENATGVSCGVCHNIHDMTDNKYAETFTEGIFNETNWSEVADSKLSFFNATASYISLTGGSTGTLTAGNDIFDTLVSPALLYPGTDANRKDASYGTAPINVTGPVSEVLCSMCHYRHGLAHIAGVNLSHGTFYYGEQAGATCTDCHMAGTNATVGKDMMKMHANDPLTPNSCGGTTKCHTTSAQNLSASSHSVIPVINEWNASAHNDKEVGVGGDGYNHFYWNNTAGVPNSRQVSCNKCHSPMDWNPVQDSNTTNVPLTADFKGITCAVCHNLHDMGDWLAKTKAIFGEAKGYAWYNKDAIVAATNNTTGLPSRYKANYTMMESTTELCGNCHSNIRIGNTGPGWASATAANPISPHGFPAKDIFVGSLKQTAPYNFECKDCHMYNKGNTTEGILNDSEKIMGHSFKMNATGLQTTTKCSGCHGTIVDTIENVIEEIQNNTHTKWNETNITVRSALATINAYNGEKNQSRDLIAKAYWNLRLVSSDESWGVHNPNGTIKMLDNATALANEANASLGQAGILTTINVSPSVATLNIGETQVFIATALDRNNTPMAGINITWTNNNTAVGNVSPLTATTDVSGSANSTFTAVAAGIAMITANNGTVAGSANVTVTTEPVVAKILISKITVVVGTTVIFSAQAFDQFNNPVDVILTWTSSNITVGTIDPTTGTFTAKADGITTINATDGSVVGSTNVTVISSLSAVLKTITVSPLTTDLDVNGTQVFTATALDQNSIPMAGIDMTWLSNDTTVGNVSPANSITDASGNATTTFTANAVGNAMVTAMNDTVAGSANVTVSPPLSWEFISVPYQLNDSTVAYVLNGIQYDALFGFDPINKIYVGGMTNFEPLKGYLIHMNTSQDITNLVRTSGQPRVPPSIDVKKGWNLIGTSGTDPKDAETMLGAIDPSYYSIWNFDVSTQRYDKIGINGMSGTESATHISTVNFTMQPKVSYWVWATQETSLPAYSP